MPSSKRPDSAALRSRTTILIAALLLISCALPAATEDVFWTGPSSGDWFTAGNWSNNQIPQPSDNVTIVNAYVTINGDFTHNGTLTLSNNTSLEITGSGTVFLANGATIMDDSRLIVSDEGQATFPTVTTYTRGQCGSDTLFAADGANSLLSLPNLQSINFDAPECFAIPILLATNGGTLNLPALEGFTIASSSKLAFQLAGGGEMDLSALAVANNAVFQVDAASSLDLPALVSAANGSMAVADGGGLTAANLASIENFIITAPNINGTVAFDGLESITFGGLVVPEGGVWNLPELVTINTASVSVHSNGLLNAPKLASFTVAPLAECC